MTQNFSMFVDREHLARLNQEIPPVTVTNKGRFLCQKGITSKLEIWYGEVADRKHAEQSRARVIIKLSLKHIGMPSYILRKFVGDKNGDYLAMLDLFMNKPVYLGGMGGPYK